MSTLVARWKSPPRVGRSGVLLAVFGVFHSVGVAGGDAGGGVVQASVEDADCSGLLGWEAASLF